MPVPSSLFLAAADPAAVPDRAAVLAVLRELAVIAEPLSETRFAAGPGFARHIVFAGCSPYLVTTPPADGSRDFCHVAVHGPYPHPRLLTGPNTVKPRCPACRGRFDDWRGRLADWSAPGADLTCPHCAWRSGPERLDWRGHAIAARFLIEVAHVFPGEAAPDDRLLARLHEASGLAWTHAWAASLADED